MTNKKRMEMDEVNKTVQSIEDLKKIDNKDELIKNMTLTYSKLSKISPTGIEKMISSYCLIMLKFLKKNL